MDSRARLRHKKMIFLHEDKIIFDWKGHPFLKEDEENEENVKITFCDNAGENKNLEENCAKTFDEIKFEFTSPGTPHQNGVVGTGFDTLYSQMRVILVHAGLRLAYVPNAR